MKKFQLYSALILATVFAGSIQNNLKAAPTWPYPISIEPGIGISPMPIMDVTFSNILQMGLTHRFSVVSYTALKENNLFLRNFNYIRTSYNYTIKVNIGIGVSLYTKRSEHTFSVLGGVRHETYEETLENPKFEKAEVAIASTTPDAGLMYNVKLGKKKLFFSYRMYIPLYPYPFKSKDITAVDANLANVSIEFGFGFRLNAAVPSNIIAVLNKIRK